MLKEFLDGKPVILPLKPRAEMNQAELRELDHYLMQATCGDPDAEFITGLCCFAGYGTEKDYLAAVRWYLKASEEGHMMAEYNLGACYARGLGVPKNFVRSAKWFRLSAEKGFAPAQFNLGCRYFAGEGVPQSDQKAVYWWEASARQGYVYALIMLADCHMEGRGGLQADTAEAYAILCDLNQDMPEVKNRIESITKKLTKPHLEEHLARATAYAKRSNATKTGPWRDKRS